MAAIESGPLRGQYTSLRAVAHSKSRAKPGGGVIILEILTLDDRECAKDFGTGDGGGALGGADGHRVHHHPYHIELSLFSNIVISMDRARVPIRCQPVVGRSWVDHGPIMSRAKHSVSMGPYLSLP